MFAESVLALGLVIALGWAGVWLALRLLGGPAQ